MTDLIRRADALAVVKRNSETCRKNLGRAKKIDDANIWSSLVARCDMIADAIATIPSAPNAGAVKVNEEQNTEQRKVFWNWLPLAYRDGHIGEEPKFSKYNMEVAHYAGWSAAIETTPDPRDAVIARLVAERDEATRRRDAWKAKADGFDAVRLALREKVGAPWPPSLSRVLWAGIAADEKARADAAEAVIARLVDAAYAIEMWDAARGYPIPYRHRDPLRAALAAAKEVMK